MAFLFRHTFRCRNCSWEYVVDTRGNAMTEVPVLPEGTRTLHSELDPRNTCFGIVGYAFSSVAPPRESTLLKLCLMFMKPGMGRPLKTACEEAIQQGVAHGRDRGRLHPDQALPEDFWTRVQAAQEGVNRRREALKPSNAREALDKVIHVGGGRDFRTMAVAFNKKTGAWKTGYSAGLGGLVWSRRHGSVTANPHDEKVQPLVDVLNDVNKVASLDREVWVCAETDAAVKALREGWFLGDLEFAAAEYPDGLWRNIKACGHCEQWCS